MISPAQIKAIHALKNKLGMDDDEYRDLLYSNYHKKSSKYLTFQQAKELISFMHGTGIKNGVVNTPDKPGLCTRKQQYMLLATWKTVSFAPENDQRKALDVFIRNRFKVGCLRWLPKDMVGKVRHTLLTMQKSKEKDNVNNNK